MRNSLGERKPTPDDGGEALGNGGDQPGSRLVPQPDAVRAGVPSLAAGSRK
ncbi:hypothetical protein SGLAU_12310 [Streptomyces glaucescens]|uniref:Uncharacterized protein n=1 Tax=Streptomyces glaucescens TaxID=1907 RepID=A0A089X5N1_STRGA|nr:hypothetical protein SGLAU_12310 [Streptomyces glaucescens]